MLCQMQQYWWHSICHPTFCCVYIWRNVEPCCWHMPTVVERLMRATGNRHQLMSNVFCVMQTLVCLDAQLSCHGSWCSYHGSPAGRERDTLHVLICHFFCRHWLSGKERVANLCRASWCSHWLSHREGYFAYVDLSFFLQALALWQAEGC